MTDETVVSCTDCSFEEGFPTLRRAREAMDAHERETGHTVDWAVAGVSAGVEAAGDAAGVCGVPGSSAESPFWPDGEPAEEESTDRE
jgi:hypothetical protein